MYTPSCEVVQLVGLVQDKDVTVDLLYRVV